MGFALSVYRTWFVALRPCGLQQRWGPVEILS